MKVADYHLGDADEETQRLCVQHDIWLKATRQVFSDAGFGPGQRLADLGCGPGLTTRDLALRVGPDGHVTGIDQSDKFIQMARGQPSLADAGNIEYRHQSVSEGSFSANSLDGVFARWLFLFLSEPASLVRSIASWLKPGGQVALMDYFNYRAFTLAPRSQTMDKVVQAIETHWASTGGSLEIAGQLPVMLEQAGLAVQSIRPTMVVTRPDQGAWNWPRAFLQVYTSRLVKDGLITEQDCAALFADWEGRAKTPGAYLVLPPVLAIIARKQAG